MPSSFAYIAPATGPAIHFDAIISETHENKSQLTEHPVEKGSDVTDNIRHDPESVTLEGIITNTPIDPFYPGARLTNISLTLPEGPANPSLLSLTGLLEAGLSALGSFLFGAPSTTAQVLQFSTPFDNIRTVHNALTAIERAGIICTVYTSTKNYDSMALVGISMPRTALGSAEFKVEFRRINIVATATVAAPVPKITAGDTPKAAGSQTPTDSSKTLSSFAAQGADAGAGAVAGLVGL